MIEVDPPLLPPCILIAAVEDCAASIFAQTSFSWLARAFFGLLFVRVKERNQKNLRTRAQAT
jgi:hypothetical protein